MQVVRATAVIAVVAFVAVPVVADAKPKPIKAEFLCGTFVNGAIKEPIKGGKRGKITDSIACAIHVGDAKEPSHMGTVYTIRYGVDPTSGKKTKVTNSGKTDDFGSQSDDAKKDFNVILAPGSADANGEIPFKACEDFDIVARIADDMGTYFTKTIKVVQSCPKPTPIAAKLTCTYEAQDGTLMKWPGNGAKDKPRLSTGKSIDCMIYAALTPTRVTLTGSAHIKGKPSKPVTDLMFETPGGGAKVDLSIAPGEETFSECEPPFVLEATLLDQDGATRWAGTQKFVQSCPN